jgi:hypothetical protein
VNLRANLVKKILKKWKTLRDDNKINNSSKKYRVKLLEDSNQGLSSRSSGRFTTPLQVEI